MTVLADTSIWIDFFRGRDPAASELERLLEQRELVVCGPVLAEIVAGAAEEQREDIVLSLGALPIVELDAGAWIRAGSLTYELRRRGGVVPLLDVLVAVAAMQEHAELWTRDDDFVRIAEAAPALRLRAHPGTI